VVGTSRTGERDIVVFSPHLDDAVLSAWHVLSSTGRIRVVNVFAGVPEPGFVTDLDRSHGATDSAAWLRRRRAEDEAALAVAGRRPVHLDLLEVQFPAYRSARARQRIAANPSGFLSVVCDEPELCPDPARLLAVIEEHVTAQTVVYSPTGIGGHPDHWALAHAAGRLAGRIAELRLYADSPYFLFDGLPSWIAGPSNPAADHRIGVALSALEGRPRLERHVTELTGEDLANKLVAIGRYTTEMPSLLADLDRAGYSLEAMRYEISWTVLDAAD
jgi:LmbE family N-acetylglucosaminyl deacetylase